MARSLLTATLTRASLAAASLASAGFALALLPASPAQAQFNPFEAIFGSPPRPPGAVPGARQPAGPPPPQQQAYPQYPDQRYEPRTQDPAYQDPRYQQRGPAPGGVQSQPLPPPPGSVTTATVPPAGQAPLALPGGPRRGAPADAAPQPGDEVVAEPPSQKILNKSAQFSGLDKITGRIINFDAGVGETVQFGALQVTTRACYTRPPTETANTDAFIEIDEVTLQGEIKRIFTGWMFASSPGLHAVEHPIYDVWLTDCKNPLVVAAPVEPAPAPAAPAPKPAAPRRPAQQPAANAAPPAPRR
jgi:hypothetical protein